jgi:hypothetical protein
MQPPPLPGYPAPPPAAAMPPPAAPAFAMPPAYAAPAPAPQGYPGPAVAAPAHYPAPAGQPATAPAPAVGMPQPGQPYPAYAQPAAQPQAAPAPNPYAPAPAPQPFAAGGPNPFFGIPLPGERHPDVPNGNHVLDVEKLRLTEDRQAVIVTFKAAASDSVSQGETLSEYMNLYGYRSQALSGELIKLLLACVGCSTYEQLQAAGPERTAMYVAIGQKVIAGEENAITGCRVSCYAYPHKPTKGNHVGKTFTRTAFDAYRPPNA